MRLTLRILVCAVIAASALGCGNSGLIKAKGRVVKGGQPFLAPEGEGVRRVFEPASIPQGATQYDSFAAEYHPDDGTFEVQGKNGLGLPPGAYRVSLQILQHKEDVLNGGATGKKSPFTCEVTNAGGEVVIDLDRIKVDPRPARAPSKSRKR
jgi:hypothetical protein